MHACNACTHVCLVNCLSVPCVCVRTYIRECGRPCMHVCMAGELSVCLSVPCAGVHM